MKVNEGKKKDFFMKPVGISRKTHQVGGVAANWRSPQIDGMTRKTHQIREAARICSNLATHHPITPSLQSPPSGSSPIKPNQA
jgi:hypothetical protein